MSEAQDKHKHINRYTVYMDDTSKLCGYSEHVFFGVDSSLKDGELLIFKGRGFYSLNYARVRWVEAEETDDVAEEHKHE